MCWANFNLGLYYGVVCDKNKIQWQYFQDAYCSQSARSLGYADPLIELKCGVATCVPFGSTGYYVTLQQKGWTGNYQSCMTQQGVTATWTSAQRTTLTREASDQLTGTALKNDILSKK